VVVRTLNAPPATLGAKKIARAHLIEIQAGVGSATFYRFTDYTANVSATIGAVPVTFNQQACFLSAISSSAEDVQAAQVAFFDANQIIKGIALTQNLRYWPANIWVGYMPAQATPGAVQEPLYVDELIIGGFCDGLELNEEGPNSRAVLGIISGGTQEQETGPKKSYSRNGCQHRYKDEMCAAVSPLPDCPRTMEACIERNNLARFGAQPYAPVAGSKFLWGPFHETVRGKPIWVPWD
jgi:hypothetical protein